MPDMKREESKSDLNNNSMMSLCEMKQHEYLSNLDADFVCSSREQITEVHSSWIIENLNTSLYENGEMIESVAFPNNEQEKDEWSLRIYPKRAITNSAPLSKFIKKKILNKKISISLLKKTIL